METAETVSEALLAGRESEMVAQALNTGDPVVDDYPQTAQEPDCDLE
jgi:hypothetical protein